MILKTFCYLIKCKFLQQPNFGVWLDQRFALTADHRYLGLKYYTDILISGSTCFYLFSCFLSHIS